MNYELDFIPPKDMRVDAFKKLLEELSVLLEEEKERDAKKKAEKSQPDNK